jgi:hypothetical protein
MNDEADEANVPREPWKRLLEDPADGPPETTDARIRAAARRDLVPRGQRWWLPASLAASFVLAVLIVRSEFGGSFRIPAPAEDRGDSAVNGVLLDLPAAAKTREAGRPPPAAARSKAEQREEPDSDGYDSADTESGQDEAGMGPRVGGPERELRSASEAPEERMDLERETRAYAPPPLPPAAAPAAAARSAAGPDENLASVTVTAANRKTAEQAAPGEPSAWTPKHVAAPVDNLKPQSTGALAKPPTPEAWYAAIEKLRREGRKAEADRELEKLKAAYPGWLEEHLRKSPR